MRRRHLLAMIGAALAMPAAAAAEPPRLPIGKAFPFLVGYLALSPAQRSLFYLAYRAFRDKRPTADARATIVFPNGVRTPVTFDHAGIVAHLPSLAELKSGASVEIDGAPFQLGLELRPVTPPSLRVDVGALAQSLAQVNAAAARVAGALAFVVPKLTAAYFPDSVGGQALLADGRLSPLPVVPAPVVGPVAYFEPSAVAAAKAVVFAKAPSRILLGAHPKKT